MCGISALLGKKSINLKLYQSLEQLQNRGYDSAGFSVYHNNSFPTIKYASTNEMSAMIKCREHLKELPDSTIGICHTRWATHGGKTDFNSHPHQSWNGKFILVHNGIIENYAELKSELEKKGVNFKSQTDTEVISNLIAWEYNKHNRSEHYVNITEDITSNESAVKKAIKSAITKLQGTWGLAIMCVDTPNILYAIRHGSPLLIGQNDDEIMVVSEQSGFCGRMIQYLVLENNDLCVMKIVNHNQILCETFHQYKPKMTQKGDFKLSPEPYPHWTLKEIEEQPESILRAISNGGRLFDKTVRLGGLEDNRDVLKTINHVIFLACGTSYHATMVGQHYFREYCDFDTIQLYDGAEFEEECVPKSGKTALILLSQSGETKDLHRCIDIAKKKDLFMIGVINVVDSLIAREVHCGCYLNAGREVAVASTKAFTSQLVILSLMSLWFAQLHDCSENRRIKLITSLKNLSQNVRCVIRDSKKWIDNVVSEIKANKNIGSIFLLGKGKCEAIAKEGSLKIKEIAYYHAEGYSGSALKHGPFALLDENCPVILIDTQEEHYDKMGSVYEEVKSRGSPIYVITGNKKRFNYDNERVLIIDSGLELGEIIATIPLQILAYKLSVEKGINPDQPKNLAKVVTVE